ncbi:MAG: hypothetical protein QOJ51_3651 [Acidobacteriaceae bacterium]|jgi:hypothetical protein|nr:hypothetical protein [Acidobacteriaceae bacterium]MDX6459548.1 hypothetical protein [Acidobacteriaceae bacterium]MEA2260826.1 hypothetical protein [Acidobacteriaceae bacterium]
MMAKCWNRMSVGSSEALRTTVRYSFSGTRQADEADELSSQELQNWPGDCTHSEFKIPLLREAYFTHQVVEARIGAERIHKWVKE